jgi:universal stress protein A
MEIKKIVVPVDFSELTPALIDYASELAKIFSAKILIIHITQPSQLAEMFGDLEVGMPIVSQPDIMVQIENAAKTQLAKLEKTVADKGIAVEAAVLMGVSHAEILQFAEKEKADLIVIGSHGRSGWQHFVLGSVAEKVARKSPVPVLIYRPKTKPSK